MQFSDSVWVTGALVVRSQREASTVTPGPVLGLRRQDEGQQPSRDVSLRPNVRD